MNLNGINQFNIQEYSKSDSFTAEEKQEIKTSIFEYKDSIEDNYSDNDINKKLQKRNTKHDNRRTYRSFSW